MVLTDPKGELFHRTSGFLKSLGYKVLCLDFRTMDKDCFNILSYAASTYRTEDKDKGLSQLSDCKMYLRTSRNALRKIRFGRIPVRCGSMVQERLCWMDFEIQSGECYELGGFQCKLCRHDKRSVASADA